MNLITQATFRVLLCTLPAMLACSNSHHESSSLPDAEPEPVPSQGDAGDVQGGDANSSTTDAGPAGTDAGTNPPDGSVVRVEPDSDTTAGTAFTHCASHADCGLANDGCSLCCEQTAVRRELVNEYEQARADACDAANFGPAPCDCGLADLLPRCERGQCTVVPRAAFVDSCYSPERTEAAYDSESVGCSCEREGQQICVGGAALFCEPLSGTGLFAWRAVQDGPCWPRQDECPDGTVVADVQACLSRFADCYEREDGSYCGVGAELASD